MNQKEYWNKTFKNEGVIWSWTPCKSAFVARDKFIDLGVKSVLIPGAGYGRNAKFFTDSGFIVVGIEISETAIEIAGENGVNIKYFHGSLLDMPFDSEKYDSIFCFTPKVFETVIASSTKLAEAPSFGKPIIHYDKYSAGAAAYELLAQEVIARLGAA